MLVSITLLNSAADEMRYKKCNQLYLKRPTQLDVSLFVFTFPRRSHQIEVRHNSCRYVFACYVCTRPLTYLPLERLSSLSRINITGHADQTDDVSRGISRRL